MGNRRRGTRGGGRPVAPKATPLPELQALHEVPLVPYKDAFLIADLLTARMTYLTGEPKAGKSLFAAGMIRALIEGRTEFLGLAVHRQLDHVIYGYTDDGADEELRARFHGTEAERKVRILPMFDTDAPYWTALTRMVIEQDPGLFVVDTVLGSLIDGEEIGHGVTGARVVKRVRPIAEAGIPVLLITHTPKGLGEGGSVPSSVIGSRALAGGARGVIALRKSKKKGHRLQTTINRARADLDMYVTVERENGEDDEVPLWTRITKQQAVVTNAPKWTTDLVAKILADQPAEESHRALGLRYEKEMQPKRAAETIRKALTHLVHRVDGKWVSSQVKQGETGRFMGQVAA